MPESIQWGRAQWPVAEACVSCSYTCSHGITPSVAVLSLPLDDSAPAPAGIGRLKITDGFGVVRLPGCKLVKVSCSHGTDGDMVHLYIADRRWKWKFGSISGAYNLKDEAGFILPATERTPIQLAEACLLSMGETNFAINGLPVDQRPQVDWQNANPAEALQALCDLYDCRVVYRPSSDSVLIARRGVGDGLPGNRPFTIATPEVSFPGGPDAIKVVGGPVWFEAMFVLEAVGQDIDGSIKPIDQLSYRPKDGNGWNATWPPNLDNIPKLAPPEIDPDIPESDESRWQRLKDFAARSVYKWYRITLRRVDGGPFDKGFMIAGYKGPILRLDQILLHPFRLLAAQQPDGSFQNLPARVSGVYVRDRQVIQNQQNKNKWRNTPNTEVTETAFSIDQARGIVMFNEPMYRIKESNGKIYPADLVLLCACQIRDAFVNQVVPYEFMLASGDPQGNGVAPIHRQELSLRIRGVYTQTNPADDDDLLPGDGAAPPRFDLDNSPVTNKKIVDAEAAIVAARAAAFYSGQDAALEMTYPGILPFSPDGAIQQVTWEVTPNGTFTTASRNTEHAYWLPDHVERRRLQIYRPRFMTDPPTKSGLLVPAEGPSMRDWYGTGIWGSVRNWFVNGWRH